MKLIVGLGNPGPQYARTRHNAGFMVVDRLAARYAPGVPARGRFNAAIYECPIGTEKVLLIKPTTFMNRCGSSVAEAANFYKIDVARDLLVVTDDIYLPCGSIRIRPDGGDGGHNGLADVERALGTQRYPRLRIGVDPKPPFMDQADYVLTVFTEEQRALVEPALDRAADAADKFVRNGLDASMNAYNVRPRPAGGQTEDKKPKEQDSE